MTLVRLASSPSSSPTSPRATSREVVQVYLQPAEDDQPIRLVGWTTVDARGRRDARRRGHLRPARRPHLGRRRLAPAEAAAGCSSRAGWATSAARSTLPPDELEAVLADLAGRPVEDATRVVTEAGWEVRAYSAGSALTMDYRKDRMNLEHEEGVVNRARVG